METEIYFTLKDLIYICGLLAGGIAGHFTVKIKLSNNKIQIDNLKEALKQEVQRTDSLANDVKQAVSLLMEIKGLLNKK